MAQGTPCQVSLCPILRVSGPNPILAAFCVIQAKNQRLRAAGHAPMWRTEPVSGGTIPYNCHGIAQDALRAIAGTWVDRMVVGPVRRSWAGLVPGRNEARDPRSVQFTQRDPQVGAWPGFDVEPLGGSFKEMNNPPRGHRSGGASVRSASALSSRASSARSQPAARA
jgi:hypothetical protein